MVPKLVTAGPEAALFMRNVQLTMPIFADVDKAPPEVPRWT